MNDSLYADSFALDPVPWMSRGLNRGFEESGISLALLLLVLFLSEMLIHCPEELNLQYQLPSFFLGLGFEPLTSKVKGPSKGSK